MADQRDCPVSGCSNTHPPDHLMCRGHWYSVPRGLRGELWSAYRHEGVLSERYQAAREACIAAAEGR